LTAFCLIALKNRLNPYSGLVGGRRIRTAPPLPLEFEFVFGVINGRRHKTILSDGILPQQIR
jgi:hypothetical protein